MSTSDLGIKVKEFHHTNHAHIQQVVQLWLNQPGLILACISPQSLNMSILQKALPQIALWSNELIEYALEHYDEWTSINRACALKSALAHEHDILIDELIQKGAEEHLKIHFDRSALMMALDYNSDISLMLLADLDADATYQQTATGHDLLIHAIKMKSPMLLAIFPFLELEQAPPLDHQGQSALHHAVDANMLDIVPELSRVIDPDTKNRAGLSPLHQAIIAQNTPMVEILLQSGSDLTQCNNHGENGLHLSLKQHYFPKCILHLCAHLELNIPDNNGHYPLMIAIEKEDRDMIKALIKKGDGLVNQNPGLCCITAIFNKRAQSKLKHFLTDCLYLAIDMHPQNHHLRQRILFSAIAHNQKRLFDYVAKTCQSLHMTDHRQYSLLQHAICHQCKAIISYLIDEQVMLQYKHPTHACALTMACQLGDARTLKHLVRSGFKTEPQQVPTIIMACLRRGQLNCLKIILKTCDPSSQELLDLSIMANNTSAVLFSCQRDTSLSIHVLLEHQNPSFLQTILKKAPHLMERKDAHGCTLLAKAVQEHQLAWVKELLKQGADTTCCDNNGSYLQDYSTYQQSYQLQELLPKKENEDYLSLACTHKT